MMEDGWRECGCDQGPGMLVASKRNRLIWKEV